MKVRIYILLLAIVIAATPLQAQEQGQSQGSSQGAPQGASVVPASSSMDAQGIGKYLLGPGDTLDVRVFGQSDLNWQGEVEADGTITSLPFIEAPIRVQCRTDKEVQRDIVAAYSKFLRKPQISVRVTGRNSRKPATIFGAVVAPTRVQMFRRIRLNEVITLSGGITERANGDIQILHTEPVMCPELGEVVEPENTAEGVPNTLKVYRWADLLAGKPEANPVLRPGDVVTVMESKPVYLTGSIASPQPVLLREGYTLTRVVAMVGGVTSGAKSSDIRIYRTAPGTSEEKVLHVDLDAVKKRKRADVVLEPYDIIEVPRASEWSPGVLLKGFARSLLGSVMGAPGAAMQYRTVY